MDSDSDSMLRMRPWPSQRGQTIWLDSPRLARRRWRESSSRPKREIRPNCTRARSNLSAPCRRFSTSRWCLLLDMSMKSNHQAAKVADAHLAGDFLGRLQVGVERGLLDELGSASCRESGCKSV